VRLVVLVVWRVRLCTFWMRLILRFIVSLRFRLLMRFRLLALRFRLLALRFLFHSVLVIALLHPLLFAIVITLRMRYRLVAIGAAINVARGLVRIPLRVISGLVRISLRVISGPVRIPLRLISGAVCVPIRVTRWAVWIPIGVAFGLTGVPISIAIRPVCVTVICAAVAYSCATVRWRIVSAASLFRSYSLLKVSRPSGRCDWRLATIL
jgi:hypothetical protein